jgi:hypothetical protein
VNTTSYIFSIVASLLAMGVVVERLRRRRLRERHAVWWLLAGLVAVVVSVFPALLSGLSGVLGVQQPANLAFFASIVVIFIVCVQYSAELTDLEDKVRRLAEEAAMADLRLHDLERAAGIGSASEAVRPEGAASTRRPADGPQSGGASSASERGAGRSASTAASSPRPAKTHDL